MEKDKGNACCAQSEATVKDRENNSQDKAEKSEVDSKESKDETDKGDTDCPKRRTKRHIVAVNPNDDLVEY